MPEGFSGDPVTKWCSGDLGFRRMELCETLTFTDHVQEWIAEKGRIIDGASIPRALWTAVGSPYTGRYRRPSIIHDIACEDAQSDGARRNADKMFYRACRSEGLSRVESAILYCGVRFGAWISGGHLAEEPEFPRVTEDSSDNYQQKLFAEITQEVVRDADRLSAFPKETEADVLEEAFDASLAKLMRRKKSDASATYLAPLEAAAFPDKAGADGEWTANKRSPGHRSLPFVGDMEFNERLIDSPCGSEDRAPVESTLAFPHSAICYLVLNGRFGSARGTGFFISPDTIVTAAHCLYGRLGYIRSAQVIAGRNGENWPFPSVTASKFAVPPEWSRQRRVEFDFGVIKLGNSGLGTSVGHFDLAALSDDELKSAQLSTAGYPSDMPISSLQHMNSGPCELVLPQRLGYSLDTWKGASGSPVWTERDGRKVAVGIHNYGHCPNFATRINADVLNRLNAWIEGGI